MVHVALALDQATKNQGRFEVACAGPMPTPTESQVSASRSNAPLTISDFLVVSNTRGPLLVKVGHPQWILRLAATLHRGWSREKIPSFVRFYPYPLWRSPSPCEGYESGTLIENSYLLAPVIYSPACPSYFLK